MRKNLISGKEVGGRRLKRKKSVGEKSNEMEGKEVTIMMNLSSNGGK